MNISQKKLARRRGVSLRDPRRLCSVSLLALCIAVCGQANVRGQETVASWSAFQNGGHLEVSLDALATRWSPDKNIAWISPIEGYGQSTPVIADGQIYVTSVSGAERQKYHLAAFGLSDGEKIWQRDFDNPTVAKNTPMTSRAAPSPIADSGGCIAFFEGGVVVSLNQDGEMRWSRNLVVDYGPIEARHGLSASLEQDEQRVFVWIERSDSPYLLALDKTSGENLWKVDGLGSTSWSSPRLIPTSQGDHLVCSASGKIVGIEPKTGRRLWEFTDIAANTSCTPVPAGLGRFLIGASDGRGEEASGAGARHNGVVEIKHDGEKYSASYRWNAQKATSSFGSPIVALDAAWIVNRTGVLYQLDLETGKRLAINRTSAGGIWATPLVAGKHLYLFGSKGTTAVISLEDGKEVTANRLWDSGNGDSASGGVLYAAAAVGPYLILRRGDRLYAVKNLP
ncbi:PQQ-binding-like beta-propeller repeat protein [Planctomycetes bacterium K23_9]|uniref:Outer membrane biogenesis protein BamB n=1 Tax=Stieleria marina TaxID=1930275 RepID=A0A517NPB2_9BACT|nr:outer membrane biogenesis protein BamB [Planctomycetes bacterium K23_9]